MRKVFITVSLFVIFCAVLVSCSRKDDAKASIEEKPELQALFEEWSSSLDGAYSEDYASRLYKAYKDSDPRVYIKELSKCDAARMDEIISLFVGHAVNYYEEAAVKEFTNLFESLHENKSLTEEERFIVYEIYSRLLYFAF